MRLEGKVALITGGGTGIGQDSALGMAREGARVAVLGRRPGPLQETVDMIKTSGGDAMAISADATSSEAIERARQAIEDQWGRLDVLVNNAGVHLVKPFLETTLEDFDQVYNTDLRSVFLVSRTMIPLMHKNGGGSVINISSILGVLGSANNTAYCAMKGGVVQLTRAMAAELGPQIRVNCLCPSHVVTPMIEGWMKRVEEKGTMDKLNNLFPMKRIGYPRDMTGAIIFFASEESSWLTGNIFMTDGGLSCYV